MKQESDSEFEMMLDASDTLLKVSESIYARQQSVQVDELMCSVFDVNYSYATKCGAVVMQDGHCTHMAGCIRFFERIDPEVSLILTHYSSGQQDTCYRKVDGEWQAIRSGLPRPIRGYEH